MGTAVDVVTDAQRAARMQDWQTQDRDLARQAEEARRSNRDFVQVYPKGWERLQSLILTAPPAARVFAFLAQHVDGTCGAVVVSQEVMAQALGVHERTVRRQTIYLEKVGALVRIKVGTGVYAYCLDPEEVWRSWGDRKDQAAFVTRTLVLKGDRANREVRRKLRVMMGEPDQGSEVGGE